MPNAKISWFCDEKFAEILEFAEGIDELAPLPLKNKKFFKAYKILRSFKGQFDLVLDLQGLIKSALVAKLLGAKEIIGFDKNSAKESLASLFYTKKLACDYGKNIILRNLELVGFALNFSFSCEEILNKKPVFKALNYPQILEFIALNSRIYGAKNIFLAPFASEKSKCYAHFDKLISALEKHANIFLIAGSKSERDEAKILAQNSKAILLPPLSLGNLLSVINKADLIIGNDSGISHIAWAQNIATITLFGNRSGKRNSFETPKNVIFQAQPKKEIDPFHIDKSDFCINELKSDEIAKKALEILGILR